MPSTPDRTTLRSEGYATAELLAQATTLLVHPARRVVESEAWLAGTIRPGSKPLTRRQRADITRDVARGEKELRKVRRLLLRRELPGEAIAVAEAAVEQMLWPFRDLDRMEWRDAEPIWELRRQARAEDMERAAQERGNAAYDALPARYWRPERDRFLWLFTHGYRRGRSGEPPIYTGDFGTGWEAGWWDYCRARFREVSAPYLAAPRPARFEQVELSLFAA